MAAPVLAPWADAVPGQTTPVSAAELGRITDDSWTYELVEGRLVRMPLAGTAHGGYGATLLIALGMYVRAAQLGRLFTAETGFLLSRSGNLDTVLGADVAFVATGRLSAQAPAERFWRLAPDLIAEVASPSQFRPEIAAKVAIWLTAGVRLAWVVWPGRQEVDVWRPGSAGPVATLGPGDSLDGMEVVPGFSLAVAAVFE